MYYKHGQMIYSLRSCSNHSVTALGLYTIKAIWYIYIHV